MNMKKQILTFLTTFVCFISVYAQVNYRIIENTEQKISVSFTFQNLLSVDVQVYNNVFSQIFIEGCVNSSDVGNPLLPVAVNMLEIPFCTDFIINVIKKDSAIYDANTLGINFPVFPAQPSLSKSHDDPVLFSQNQNMYQTDSFYGLSLASFEKAGFVRNVNIGQLSVSPVQYNPVTHEIKLYHSIEVEIVFTQTDIVKTQTLKELHKNPLFALPHVLNPVKTGSFLKNSKAEFSNSPIKYLVVSHSMFRGALDSFVAWKKRKGFLVEVGYTDEENVGTTTASIAAFIKSHYLQATPENSAPSFVLLVGDVEQIPAFQGVTEKHPTDLYYFTWEGGNIPCCYYGRFSAQNLQQLTPQIEKTLQYEQFTMPNPEYLNKISVVAGHDKDSGPLYGNGFINYVTQNYANKKNGYKTVYAHYHPCTSQAELIRAEIGEGVGIANYTAHCSEMGWNYPDFHTYHIPEMKNLNKYGLMIGSCCLSNKFDVKECFGEALLRAEGKGAVGYIGGSNSTYWVEDYYFGIGYRNEITVKPTYNPDHLGAYDRLFHNNHETQSQWMSTFGAMIFAGNEAVQSSTSKLKHYYWEVYHLMGDPSVMTYLAKPEQMLVGIHDEILAGETILNAKVAPYSYCALTGNKEKLLSAGFADAEGNITLHFEPADTLTEYEFAAWAQNYVQFLKTIKCSVKGKKYLEIYPNPAHTTMMVVTKTPIMAYEIMDLTGRVVVSQTKIHDNITPVNVSSLANGIYFIKIVDTEQKTTIKKFVKL